CPAGITLTTTWSLPNCAQRYVPGWRPCGSTHEDASSHPGRWAAHGTWLAEPRRAMIAIVPAPCHDRGNTASDTASAGIVKLSQKIAHLCSKVRTIEGFGLARAPVFSLFPPPQLSSRERRLGAIFINLTMPSIRWGHGWRNVGCYPSFSLA